MDRQALLNNFVERVNGKGRSIKSHSHSVCKYVKEEHPGCAIGCQPLMAPFVDEMKEADEAEKGKFFEDSGIRSLIEMHPQVAIALGVGEGGIDPEFDMDFLVDLQSLHDTQSNWYNNTLYKSEVESFCRTYELELPNSEYAI